MSRKMMFSFDITGVRLEDHLSPSSGVDPPKVL
jgi:hypothetical protein